MNRLLKASGVCAAVAGLIVFSELGGLSHGATAVKANATAPSHTPTMGSAQPSSASTAMCPVANSSMITVGDAQSFATITNGVSNVPAFKGITGPDEPLWVQQYVVGRLKGYITTLSLTGRYRRAENAAASKLHYPIMKFPYVPLSGLIVKANPRMVLEVYESVSVFGTDAGAESDIASAFPGGSPSQGTALRRLPRLGNQTMGYVRAFGPNSTYERVVTIFARIGRVDVQVSTQGGEDISVADGVRLARLAEERIMNRCTST